MCMYIIGTCTNIYLMYISVFAVARNVFCEEALILLIK